MPQHDPIDDYRYSEAGQRIREAIAAAEARGDHDAVYEHENELNDLRIQCENSGVLVVEPPIDERRLNLNYGPVTHEHGEWECRESDYDDSDGFTSPWWTARHKPTGETRLMHLSRFRFTMTQERFAWLVDNDFPRHPRGNWDNASIDEAMKGEPA